MITKIKNFYQPLLLAIMLVITALALWGVTAAYAGWNAPIPASPDTAGDVGEYTSLAVVGGYPAISYYDSTNDALKYARATNATGSSWGSPVAVNSAGDGGEYTSLAVVDGNPAISYYDSANGDLKYIRATDVTGNGWGSPVTVDDSSDDVGQYSSLVMVNGNPAISYYDDDNGDLKYARATDAAGSSWITYTVDITGDVGECASLAVVNGNPAISYHDSTGALKYARATNADGSSWGSPVAVISGRWLGECTSLAVVNGNPAISYYDQNSGDLKYVRAIDANGSGWGAEVAVNSAADGGEYSSLAVVNGYPAISYYNRANGDLKYAQAANANGSSWDNPLTLDSTGNVGRYTLLAMVNGNPAISYYDSTNGDLKYIYFIQAPEIAALGNGAVIANGDTGPNLPRNTLFLTPGEAVTHTFTISNSGELDLNLSGSPLISITGPAAGDYSVTILPATPVISNSTATFAVRFAPAVTGTRAATVTIANNDPDEAPYTFAIEGTICSHAITVQNANDNGPGSLRQALTDICDGGAIDFAADTAITLSSPLSVNRSVTLSGQGHAVTISGNDSVRVFAVVDSAHVTFDHLTIAHGQTTTPEVFDMYPVGGGVKIEAGAVVTLTNSTVLSNATVYYNAEYSMYFGYGGGIYNMGALTVLTSTFSGNTSGSNAGWGDGDGGAIYNSNGALTVINSTFSGNSAYSGSGGGLANEAGTLTVQNSTFSSNSAPCGAAAISNEYGTAAISDSTIADNVAPGSWCEGEAAGIGNRFGTMTISRSTISGNISEGGSGGGLSNYGTNPNQGRLTVTDSAIYSNSAYRTGGGIYNWWDSVMTVTNCSIYSNTAEDGGGVLNGGSINTKLTLINSTLAHNTAEDGGGLYNGTPIGFSGEVLTMVNSTVVSNTATNHGGGIYNRNSANATLSNIILWDNAPAGPQIYNSNTLSPTISYSDIQNSGGSASWDTGLGADDGNNIDADPLLGPLADNALSGTGDGDTLTYALLSGSPAINAGDNAVCPATDQRGLARPQGSACDIGAFEF